MQASQVLRSYLKYAFLPNLGVGRKYQSFEIPYVFTTQGIGFAGTSDFIFTAALTLDKNPYLR